MDGQTSTKYLPKVLLWPGSLAETNTVDGNVRADRQTIRHLLKRSQYFFSSLEEAVFFFKFFEAICILGK